MAGLSSAMHQPCIVAMPMRRPVKLPGPAVTAKASIRSRLSSQPSSRAFIMGSSVSE